MAAPVTLDLVLLRSEKPKNIALYLGQLLQEHQPIDVCKELLAAVEAERLSSTVFWIFFCVTESLDSITLCMRQTFSIKIRMEGIEHYGRALRSIDNWKRVWQSLGGLNGILQYLSMISVNEVKAFCRTIGKCNFGQQKSRERAEAVEELIKAMNPGLYPDTTVQTPDKRPLGSFAGYMVLACSADFVYSLMIDNAKKSLYDRCKTKHLVRAFPGPARRYVDSQIWMSKTSSKGGIVHLMLLELARHEPPVAGEEKYFSASMEYSERILERRMDNKKAAWPNERAEANIYFGLLKRCVKRRITKQRLHGLYSLGMRLLAAFSNLLSSFPIEKREFWGSIVNFWIKWPEYWEDLFIRGLQLGLLGKSKVPDLFENFLHSQGISDFTADRIWTTLRLFYLYIPKTGIDIDALDEQDEQEPLAKTTWPIDVLDRLPSDKAIPLLKTLLRVNTKFNFLSCRRANTILSVLFTRDEYNINALLYLIQRQLDSPLGSDRAEALERVVETCAEFKTKSASSKEQPDRAKFARAMGFFAIASRSLDIYGEYVEWLARFIRDPLTVKVIFRQDLIANNEVTTLLSAIPDGNSEPPSLSDVSENISQADKILLSFKVHHKTAKREPSYHAGDWESVDMLLRSTLRLRIARAEVLQKSLNASQGQLYGQLWSETLSRFSQPGVGIMSHVDTLISGLVARLPSKLLLNVTKTVQEIEATYKAKKSEGGEIENEYYIINQLANQCILALAKGDNVTSTGSIIIETIINHPEASSWHRQMLSLGFFKRLPAASAQQLLLDFAEKIGEKLEEQSYVRVGEAANTPSIVKVTTVKYLAQILQGAEFLSAESSIDVLLELFKVATHPDIRQATLESMLSTLTGLAAVEMQGSSTDISRSKNLMVQKILAALDTIVPVIGSINERRVPTEQDWREAESDPSLLPQPSPDLNQRFLWGVLVASANRNKSLKSYFVQRLLLPGLEASVKTYRQWLALFLKKYNAGFSVDQLPVISATPAMLANALTDFLQQTPRKYFECWVRYLTFLFERPEYLVHFKAKLETDEKINTKPDVLHFLSVFGYDVETTFRMGTNNLLQLINHSWKPSLLEEYQAVTVAQVQGAILNHLQIILHQYDQNIGLWNRAMATLRHPTGQPDWKHWRTDCYPLLEQVVALIEKLRTPRWLSDPQRSPSILPSTIRLRLWMLDYPLAGASSDMSDQQAAKLGHQLVNFLSDLLGEADTLIKPDKIIADMMTVSEKISDRERLQVGLVLGSFTGLGAIEESLRVSLAIEFFQKGLKVAEKDETLRSRLVVVLKQWQTSQVEDVRETVVNLQMERTSSSLWQVAYSKDSKK